ncbi:MAG: OmpA family protein [Epsilonproteobacteria bacterium]|nr:OmpA family protein [Campylobacterota bacterium]
MHYKMLGTVCSISLLLIFSGCSTKKEVVSFDNNIKKTPQAEVVANNKIDDTKSIKIITADNGEIVSSITNGIEPNSKVVDELYNNTTSIINGEDITLKSIHFDFDMFTLTEDNLAFSIDNSKKINNASLKDKLFKIKLEGNCDEWGSDEYNYALGLKRSIAVKSDLVNRGVGEDRIVVVSYGESNPICKEQTAQCWNKNRRVDHYLIP